MRKGDIITGRVDRVAFPNRGIVRTEGGAVTVKNTVPGQVVEAKIFKKHGEKRAEARLLSVKERSPLEVEPPCPHFGLCGGCTWQNLPYEETTKLKAQQVKALLDQAVGEAEAACQIGHDGGPRYEFQGIRPSPRIYEYRNKMEFTFGDEYKGGPLALGQHRNGGFYDILTVTDCRIVDADFRTILEKTRDFWGALYASGKVTFYHRMQHTGFLRHLLVRKALHTGEILVDLVTTTQEEHEADIAVWKDALLSLPLQGQIRGILHTRNDSPADAVLDQGTETLYGQDSFTEELLGLKFRVTPFSFFQTNSDGAAVLYETAREYLAGLMKKRCGDSQNTESNDSSKPVVFDLYTGTGTIAQLMAPAAKKVIGVEIVEEAVRAARENAARNGLDNCEFIAGDVLKVLDEIPEQPDVIILDPPRDGVHPKALPKILRYGVPNILYISCKPTSLARDLAGFYLAGYRARKAVCVDMFPWTSGVETVMLLQKQN